MPEFTSSRLADALEADIRAHRLLELPVSWADEVIYPAYADLSLRNVPHTIADMLGAPLTRSAPLRPAIWQEETLKGEIGRVVVFLMDGLGYKHLHLALQQDDELHQIIADLTGGRGFVPTTSIAPTTTAVALPTLWTGGAPARTGLFGTAIYLREVWQLANMLKFAPLVGNHAPDTFSAWGFNPPDFVGMGGLAEHLASHGIPTYMHTDKKLWKTGLSQILHRGVARADTHLGYHDFYPRLADMLLATRGQRCYIGVYYPGMDSTAHQYGAHNHYTHHDIKQTLRQLRDLLGQQSLHDGQTLFMLTADHGHYDVSQRLDLASHRLLREQVRPHLVMGLSGEQRLPILHIKHGYVETVQAVIDEHFGDVMTTIPSHVALEAGLFGIPEDGIYDETPFRLGDLIAIPRTGAVLEDKSIVDLNIISWHGGLSDWEMITPLLWTRF